MTSCMSRRRALTTVAGGLALASGLNGIRASAQVPKRIEQLAPELDSITATSEPIQELASGFGGELGPAEGPVWWKEGGYLLFSDIHNNKRMKYTPGQGVTVFKEPTNPGQWAHPRYPGPAGGLRARHETCHPAGTRRQHYRDREQFSGPAPEPAERRRGQVRRQHLIHR